ncbi:hypothetical protein [Methylobacter sp. S3L5C]|uniref:hypothetical protein n=1 Tax=Methylobacter sp. S3L5C TaxID=2839024 RepID=UPI001FAE2948|nr:hypothetical protein [Methylobacter sp. S3L5C]UOA07770.1 hypothetical protein KKZ03_16155 [Methylobacter sp. S3L5C]
MAITRNQVDLALQATAPRLIIGAVGGRNLIIKSGSSNTPVAGGLSGWGMTTSVNGSYIGNSQYMSLKQNTDYTASFLCWCSTGTVPFYADLFPDSLPQFLPIATTTKTTIRYVFNSSSADMLSCILRFFVPTISGQTLYITDIKFEEGNKSSTWTAAPEDTQASIDAAAMTATWLGVVNRPTSLATLNITDGNSLVAALTSSPNLLYNGGFENGTDGWVNNFAATVDNSIWGTAITKTGLVAGTYVLQQSIGVSVQASDWCTITGDSLLLNPGVNDGVYFDLIFKNSAGAVVGDGAQNTMTTHHDFSITSSNRNVHAVSSQAPAGAVSAMARFVAQVSGTNVIIGCRQIKVERRQLPATPYSSEATLVALQAKTNTAIAEVNAISDDGILSKSEKPDTILKAKTIDNDKAGIDAQADALVISRVAYDTAITALGTYLNALTPAWNDATQNTPIVSATFNSKFEEVYKQKQLLLNAFVTKNKSLADTANSAIAIIVDDNILDKSEKPRVRKEWDSIYEEYYVIDGQAQELGTDRVNYTAAISDLYNYLNGGGTVNMATYPPEPLYINDANLTTNTNINGVTLKNLFVYYYAFRASSISLITAKAATTSLWDSVSDPTGKKPVDNATKNPGDYANLIGKVTPANRDAYLANNCTSYASSTKGIWHQINVHGSAAVPTSILITGAVYITTNGGSVNSRARLSALKVNADSSAWTPIYAGGEVVYDQATISMVSGGGVKVPFHLTITCAETTAYAFQITNDASIASWAEHIIITLEVVK